MLTPATTREFDSGRVVMGVVSFVLALLGGTGCQPADQPVAALPEAESVAPSAADPPDPYASEYRRTVHPDRLYLPTFMGKFGDEYFIVDCYNNRVLYSTDKTLPLQEWQLLDDDFSWPHSIASDGEFLVIDNTQAHEIRVYRSDDEGGFFLHQVISEAGRRPHRSVYDPASDAFFVLAAESQEMIRLEERAGELVVVSRQHLPFLEGAYARSFTLEGGRMVFVSGPGTISIVDYSGGTYELVESYPVPGDLASANDIVFTDGVVLLSASLNKLVRCESLQDLAMDSCESVYDRLGLKGNPYFFSMFDGETHMAEIAGGDTIHTLYDVGGDGLHARDLFTPVQE